MGGFVKDIKANSLSVIMTALAISLAIIGVSRAAIPNSTTGQIESCYRNTSTGLLPAGNLRVIDSQAGQSCTNQETPLSWATQQQQGNSQHRQELVFNLSALNPEDTQSFDIPTDVNLQFATIQPQVTMLCADSSTHVFGPYLTRFDFGYDSATTNWAVSSGNTLNMFIAADNGETSCGDENMTGVERMNLVLDKTNNTAMMTLLNETSNMELIGTATIRWIVT